MLLTDLVTDLLLVFSEVSKILPAYAGSLVWYNMTARCL